MRLVSLKLTHFKGARDLTIWAGGEDLSIFGQNAAGKTTVFDAHLWLLFGRDSRNRSDFEVKTIDKETGEPLHKLSHEVEGCYILDGGAEVCLKRTYTEKWTKQRGSASATFTGHETTYYIDGVPKDKSDFVAFVASICDEKKFRLLSDPGYFCEVLKWEDRRRMLVELVGGITDAEVIASSPKLKGLTETLGKHSADDMKAMLTAKRKRLNDELGTLPTRIDEARRTAGEAFDGKPQDTGEADKKVAACQAKLAQSRNGGAVTQLRIDLNGVVAQMQERETALKKAASSGFDAAQERVRSAQMALTEAQALVGRSSARVETTGATILRHDEALAALRVEWHSINDQQFVSTVTDTCPTCMRSLPPADVEAAVAKALSDFNDKKAKALEANVAKGKTAKLAWDEAKEANEKALAELDAAEALLLPAQEALSAAKRDADACERPVVDLEADEVYAGLTKQKAAIEATIGDEAKATAEVVHAAEQELETAKAELAEIARHNAQIEAAQQARDRVAELEGQEKKVSKEFEEVEGQIFLIEEFARAKARMLTERINAQFGMVKFKLFDEQLNGGLAECCEAMVDSVPYGSLNHGSRLNAGLDIIDTLGKSLGFTPVIFIDNSESVTSIRPTAAQQIRLVVSANDKALRFEGVSPLQKAS